MRALHSSVSYVLHCILRKDAFTPSFALQSYVLGSMDAIYSMGRWDEISDIVEDLLDEIADMAIEYERRYWDEKSKKSRCCF